jgi:hypothetical protein
MRKPAMQATNLRSWSVGTNGCSPGGFFLGCCLVDMLTSIAHRWPPQPVKAGDTLKPLPLLSCTVGARDALIAVCILLFNYTTFRPADIEDD